MGSSQSAGIPTRVKLPAPFAPTALQVNGNGVAPCFPMPPRLRGFAIDAVRSDGEPCTRGPQASIPADDGRIQRRSLSQSFSGVHLPGGLPRCVPRRVPWKSSGPGFHARRGHLLRQHDRDVPRDGQHVLPAAAEPDDERLNPHDRGPARARALARQKAETSLLMCLQGSCKTLKELTLLHSKGMCIHMPKNF